MIWFWNHYLNDPADADEPLASVSNADSLKGLPPAFVLTAEYDVLRDEGEKYARQLADAGVVTRAKRYDGLLHGFVHFQGAFDDSAVAIADIACEIKKHMA